MHRVPFRELACIATGTEVDLFMNQILKAARFAASKHAGQRRKNASATPYINHPIEVAEHLACAGAVADEEILIAALLHDTLEDTATTPAEIEGLFGPEILKLVASACQLERTCAQRVPSDK